MGQKIWGYRCAFAAIASLALATPLRAEDDAASESSPSSGQARASIVAAAERRIEAALDSPQRAPFDFVAQPLSDVVRIVSDDYDIPIMIDVAALDAVASSPDVEVTTSIANVTLRSALELMLKSVGEGDLTYIVDNEVLMITTLEEAEKRLEIRVYVVNDLVREGSSLVWTDDADFDPLIDVIIATVESDSWLENGTGEGEVQPLSPGMLVVAQTRRVHERIADLLQQIREAKQEVNEKGDEQRGESANRPVLRSIAFHDEAIAKCEKTREVLRNVIEKSVNWQRPTEGANDGDFVLQVLPNRVLVRHVPEVIEEVNQVVQHIIPATQMSHCAIGGGGMGGSAGGSTSPSGTSATPPNSPELAEHPASGEDGGQRQSSGRGGL